MMTQLAGRGRLDTLTRHGATLSAGSARLAPQARRRQCARLPGWPRPCKLSSEMPKTTRCWRVWRAQGEFLRLLLSVPALVVLLLLEGCVHVRSQLRTAHRQGCPRHPRHHQADLRPARARPCQEYRLAPSRCVPPRAASGRPNAPPHSALALLEDIAIGAC